MVASARKVASHVLVLDHRRIVEEAPTAEFCTARGRRSARGSSCRRCCTAGGLLADESLFKDPFSWQDVSRATPDVRT